MTATDAARRLSILRLTPRISETSQEYYSFSLPQIASQDISISTYFEVLIPTHDAITLYAGDNTIRGFLRGLRQALAARDYDVIHIHSPHVGVMFLLALLLNLRFGLLTSTVYTVHNSYPSYKSRNRLMMLPCFIAFRRVVFCSHAANKSFPAWFRRLAGRHSQTIQNGVNLTIVDTVRATMLSPSRSEEIFRTVAICRLVPVKNVGNLLTAFAESGIAEDSHLTIIGDGPLRDQHQSQIAALGLGDRVTLTGWIDREEVIHYLANADLYISTSRAEGLPIAVLEALACECPVILSDIAPHSEVASDSDFIPLLPPDDVADFAREIGRMFHLPADQRRELGMQSRQLVEDRFSATQMNEDYNQLFKRLAQNRQRSSH